MTIEQFRANDVFRARLAELLNDEVLQQALFTLRDSRLAVDVILDAPEVTSVRMLSANAAWQSCLNHFFLLARPIKVLPDVGPETWGVEDEQPEQTT